MTFRKLPFANVSGKKGRSAALITFAFFLTLSVCAGSIILFSVQNGLKNLELRLGSDIIVTPESAYEVNGIEDILLYGNRTYFYMPKNVLDEVSKIEGVELVSPQMFLATLDSGCCSVGLQIIGFDEKSDFSVKPWLTKDFQGTLSDCDIIVGSKIEVPANKTLRFYTVDCHVVAQLHETGTGLDNAVYTSLKTIKKLIESSMILGFNDKLAENPEESISSVMVKIKDGYETDYVARKIDKNIEGVKAVKTKSMTSSISDNLSSISKISFILIAAVWVLCIAVMSVVFSMIIGERKKEFAVLRAMGASRKKLSRLVLSEAVILNASGAILGTAVTCLSIFPFHAAIEKSLNLPFLLPDFLKCILIFAASILISVLTGAASASVSARKISKIDTSMILREGN